MPRSEQIIGDLPLPDARALRVNGLGANPCKLSVITPVLNGGKFIERCIRSVSRQQCPGVEHLIVDGGSTDETLAVIRRLSAELPHIRWVSASDSGQSEAMNRGLGLAHGGVVGFLMADDFYEPGVLARVTALCEDLPEPSLLVGNCRLIDEHGALIMLNRPRQVTLTELLIKDPWNPNFPAGTSCYFYHKSLHDLVGPYDANEHYVMDVAFLLQAVQVASVVRVDEVWGSFVLHPGSKTVRDAVAGTGWPRFLALLRKHHSRLNLRDRLFVEWKSLYSLPRRSFVNLRSAGARLRRVLT
jgi:glycosyltransferase involved in cell wall biosynthesis